MTLYNKSLILIIQWTVDLVPSIEQELLLLREASIPLLCEIPLGLGFWGLGRLSFRLYRGLTKGMHLLLIPFALLLAVC